VKEDVTATRDGPERSATNDVKKSGRASDGSTASRHVSIEGLPSDGDCIEIDDETTTGRVDIVGRGLVDCRSNDSQSDEEHPDQAKLSWLILGSKP